MTARDVLRRMAAHDGVNFALTNRVPRRGLTHLVGWIARLEHPWVRSLSIAVWRLFTDLDLSDARKQRFDSLHDCFVRELVPGARPLDTDPASLVSPCDAIVGACGALDDGTLLQAKGMRYALDELVCDGPRAAALQGGCYATLRLTSAMYHRFHAPADCRVRELTYVSGDVFNVNPAALKRVPRLYCRNERAVLVAELGEDVSVVLVAVAAILVASMRFRFVDVPSQVRHAGVHRLRCDASFARGDELGWFEHGSTIVMLAPRGFRLDARIREGLRLRMGEALLRRVARD